MRLKVQRVQNPHKTRPAGDGRPSASYRADPGQTEMHRTTNEQTGLKPGFQSSQLDNSSLIGETDKRRCSETLRIVAAFLS
jgi:hypothetical protein